MDLVPQSWLVKESGLTKQAISKAVKRGVDLTIVEGEDGKLKIDLDGHLTVEWMKKHPFKTKTKTHSNPGPKLKGVPQRDKPGGSALSRQDKKQLLEIEKLKEGNEKIRIDNQKKRGQLIPKILIKRVFARLYSIFENQLKGLGVAASPKISEIYNESNKTKSKQILELFEKQNDKTLYSEINKILASGEEDRILRTTGILEDSITVIIKSIKREFDKFLLSIKKLEE